MRIGYACIALGIKGGTFRNCMLKNAVPGRLFLLTKQNIDTLCRITDYNQSCGIRLYRIGSGLIPFGSHPAVHFDWQALFERELRQAGEKIRRAGVRVSMHPGQYTVLNSPDEKVVENAVLDLNYHTNVLGSLGCGEDCKIILHVGGVYGDRQTAVERFIRNARRLRPEVLARIALENDERCYNIAQVLEIAQKLKLPAVYDVLHNAVNPACETGMDDGKWISLCAGTWRAADGVQKIHYSQQQPGGRPGAHSDSIGAEEFLPFYRGIKEYPVDIMLEVKDKDLSAKKVINLLQAEGKNDSGQNEQNRL